MLSAEECRQHAKECAELAQAVGERQGAKLLKLAEAWLALADEAYRLEPSNDRGRPASPRKVA
jgi:hypothetical protein